MDPRAIDDRDAAAGDGTVDLVAEDLGEGEGVAVVEDVVRGGGEFVGADDAGGHHVDDGEVGVVGGDEGVGGL